MLRHVRVALLAALGCALVGTLAAQGYAGTIIKLDLGDDSAADIQFNGTHLAVVDDGNGDTVGLQDTEVEFLDFLSGEEDINGPLPASFSMGGLEAAGPATIFADVLVIQNFTGGTFSLYDEDDQLLLSGMLDNSTLTGPIGPPATGALFTTTFATVTGGSLAPQIIADSITLSMSLSAINGGAGFSVGASSPFLNPFSADTTLAIAAEPIPEPVTGLLLIFGSLALAAKSHRASRTLRR